MANETPRVPQVGETILTSGGEFTILKVKDDYVTIKVEDITLGYFRPELFWMPERGCWMARHANEP